jgi:PAS domain S-box-containing protein
MGTDKDKDSPVGKDADLSKRITELEKEVARLQSQNAFLKGILDTTDEVIQALDEQYRVIFTNEAIRAFGLAPEDFEGRFIGEFYPPDELQYRMEIMAKLMKKGPGASESFVMRVLDGDGNTRVMETRVFNKLAPPINGIVGFVRMLPDQQSQENHVQAFEGTLVKILNNLPEAVFIHDFHGHVYLCNEPARAMFQVPPTNEMVGGFPVCYGPVDGPDTLEQAWASLGGDTTTVREWTTQRHDGERFEVEAHLTTIWWNDQKMVLATVRDVTERKTMEKQILNALSEKEALLREAHHRVKNNFAAVTSLLRMQQRRIKDESLRRLIKETDFRIRCMGLVHEKLHQSESLSEIKIDEYLESLVINLMYSYNSQEKRTELDLEIENVELSPDTAIPLGFITSELVSNAFKHAFPSQRPGKISVRFESLPESDLQLRVKDDGVGIRTDLEIDKLDSLGLSLVRTFVNQLGGSWELLNGEGACWKIRFPKPNKRKIR